MIFVNLAFLVVRTLRNSLSDIVVKAESVNSFKGRLDRFSNDQEVKFNWKADIEGTGSRSNLIQILFYNIQYTRHIGNKPASVGTILTYRHYGDHSFNV